MQRTISRPVAVRGYGFWSGKPVRVEFRPAAVESGITFVRDDLSSRVRVPAIIEHRLDVPRRTNLGCEGATVEMVEHVLAALAGLQIDNCEIGVDAAEMPGCDGSSLAFVQALDSVGVDEQHEAVPQLVIAEPVRIASGESWIEALPAALPATNTKFRVEFQLDYPDDPIIGQQSISLAVSPDSFRQELAPCRTFVLEREADAMIRQGLGTHVTPQDLLLFGKYGPVENRLRFENECARHKTLDLIGDLALTGCEIIGQVIAHRSSHQLNAALACELRSRFAQTMPLRASA
ncbi:MAG: UDP-3-O-[3-hydroxymyristoyl] N-acetylglucosamine deacetylase [Planctomycetes bacterium]|nr:UDP-3-O-[3-hydroxymyristoyl] N-acetylglucosamine deacetylase [Planctomycetota bacterium]